VAPFSSQEEEDFHQRRNVVDDYWYRPGHPHSEELSFTQFVENYHSTRTVKRENGSVSPVIKALSFLEGHPLYGKIHVARNWRQAILNLVGY
jgi:hypothetical protein